MHLDPFSVQLASGARTLPGARSRLLDTGVTGLSPWAVPLPAHRPVTKPRHLYYPAPTIVMK